MASSDSVVQALKRRCAFEVVSLKEADNQLWILGRVPPDMARVNENNWNFVVSRLLIAETQRPWKVDLSRKYLLRGGKLAHAKRFILDAENVKQHYADVANIIATTPKAAVDVMEIPLGDGLGRDRNNPSGGRRGAGPAGSVAVGPAAVFTKMRGG
jgi:hypothetical protein